MAQDATVTAADIARLAGVGRAAVSNWRKRHDDFPQPVGGTAASPSFSLAEVQDWLRAQGKTDESTADEQLWHELRKIADEVELADMLAFAGAFLLYLCRDHAHWDALAERSDEGVAADLPGAVRAAVEGLPGEQVFPPVLPTRHVPVIRGLAGLAAGRGARACFEFLRERYLDLHKRRMYDTPPEVVRLVMDLAGSGHGTVLDPACGSGGLLLGAIEHDAGRLLGQDADEAVARLTAIRLALRTPDAAVRAGDPLRRDAFAGVEADLVVTTPPFNDRNWGYDELTADPRWEYGLPPRTESELAWVQHALAHCRPGAQAILLMPPAAANRRAGRRIRAQLLRRGALRAVIMLPLGAVPNMAVPLNLWVMRRPDPRERPPSQVLMVETSGDYAAQALEGWRRFAADPEADLDDPGRSRAVRIIDLLDEEVDLTPSRHLTRQAAAPAIERVAERRAETLGLLESLPALLPEVREGRGGRGGPDGPDAPLVPVSELVRMGLVSVHQASAVPPGAEEGLVPVLTAEDVVKGRWPDVTARVETGADAVVVQQGDVVVPGIIRAPTARVVPEGGALLGRHVFLLRPDPARLDAHFLAGVLRGSLNLRHYSMVSMSYRVDVRRAEIPMPPVEEQRRYGDAYRRLDEFETKLRRASELGADLARLLGDGLVDASLCPDTANRIPDDGKPAAP
ncbi:N-6 DNA methylase [Spirillospora sp. NBC_01491]|uniref:N-6 DNA methylase n=1 Tax=Spirillospora sp. NBC_01491 TaxID=2976007 RepID=UPI002E34036E|nr:N-6 DNA methylase [Spirillospora sp. NBC_01491]